MIRIADRDDWFFVTGNLKMTKVRDWYMEEYPTDDIGPHINKNVTLWDIVGVLNAGLGHRFYDELGTGDSIVRERVFSRIAKIIGCDYDDVYFTWLGREKPARAS